MIVIFLMSYLQGRLYNFEGPWASKKIRVY
jgi:hypothetical protein